MAEPELGLGVDFGTTTTVVAHRSSSSVAVLPIGRATAWMPSLARRTDMSDLDRSDLARADLASSDLARSDLVGSYLVGEEAEGVAEIRSVKHAITQHRAELTVPGLAGTVDVDEVVAAILAETAGRVRRAGAELDGEIRLGCPAMWDGGQRQRLLALAVAAGLCPRRATLLDEPVAAAIAWLTHQFRERGERPAGRLLVFDMGGGTVDVAVLRVAGGARPEVSVLACLGAGVAGDALDTAIAHELAEAMAENRIDVSRHPRPELAWALLERAAREAKIRLSTQDEHPVVLPRQLAYPAPLRYRRTRLEEVLGAQFGGAESLVIAALRGARLAEHRLSAARLRAIGRDELTAEVDFVLLAGGMSRVPYVARRLARLLPGARVHTSAGVPAEQAVAVGLAAGAESAGVRLHRPGLAFVVEWARGRHTVYAPHTPIFEPWQVYAGAGGLWYEHRLGSGEVPTDGPGWLRVYSAAGEAVALELDGQPMSGLPIGFGPGELVFRLFCDATVELDDGAGQRLAVRADGGWPVGESTLGLRRVVPSAPQ